MKILNSEITPYSTYLNRRKFLKGSIAAGFSIGFSQPLKANHPNNTQVYEQYLDPNDKLNKFEEITQYNNFYEFGMGKNDPYKYSGNFQPKPWSITLEGLINNPQTIDLDKLLSLESVIKGSRNPLTSFASTYLR